MARRSRTGPSTPRTAAQPSSDRRSGISDNEARPAAAGVLDSAARGLRAQLPHGRRSAARRQGPPRRWLDDQGRDARAPRAADHRAATVRRRAARLPAGEAIGAVADADPVLAAVLLLGW